MKTRRVVMLSVVALLVLLSGPLRASTPRVDSADPPQVFVDRDTAVTLAGDGFDVGAGVGLLPGGPFLAGIVEMPASGVAVVGDYAYVVEEALCSPGPTTKASAIPSSRGSVEEALCSLGYSGCAPTPHGNLQVFDVSDPLAQAPALAGRVDLPTGASGVVVVSGDYAYVVEAVCESSSPWECETRHRLRVIDVRDPQAPALAGSVDLPEVASSVAVAGNYAYVTSGSRLQVIDVRNPQAPALAGSVYTWGDARDVAVAGDYAYVTNGSGLLVIDVSCPRAPALVGGVRTPGDPRSVAVAGDYAYVVLNREGFCEVDWHECGCLVWNTRVWVQVIDVNNPHAPTLAGHVDTTGEVLDVAVVGDYAYVVRNTDNVAVWWLNFDCNYLGVQFTRGSLQVIDVSDPLAPGLASGFDTGRASDVALAGNFAYVVAEGEPIVVWWDIRYGPAGLNVIDVSAPQPPASTPNPPLRDVATPADSTIGLTVPAGFAPGPYHVEVTNPDGAAATLHNGLRACERHALDASLEPILEAAFPRIRREPVPWRMTLAGDAGFFAPKVRHEGRLLLPELPATLGTRLEPAGGSGRMAIELRLGWPNGTGEVVLIGDDTARITALWEAMRSAGGYALPRRDDHAYGDVVLQLDRTPAALSTPSRPEGSALGGVIVPGPAPIRYRYDFAADGRLTAARATGPAVDLIFQAVGRDKYRCETTDTIRYTEALTAACEEFAALHPQLVVDCSR